jgi:hypothetical protein
MNSLEQAAGVLADLDATSGDLDKAAQLARGAVSAIDDAIAAHPELKAEIFNRIAPPAALPGKYRLRPHSISETVDNLLAHEREGQAIWGRRAVAAWLAAALDKKAREVEKTEAAIVAARAPFKAEAQRAAELAKAFATYPALAERVVELLVTDVAIRRQAKSAYSTVPRHHGSRAVGRIDVFESQWAIATPEILSKTILPCIRNGSRYDSYFPGRYGDFTFIENPNLDVDASFVAELAELSRGAPTVEAVNRAVAKADAKLVSEFGKVIASIASLRALDASIDAAELGARYPDGGKIFADELFPEWAPRTMARWIVLPEIGGYRMAAE